uniref:Peptidase M12A domain-containing protein n=1 Tax=Megaselia scalaris TaxID=36166 RepID=T1GDZ2_MEGSC
MKIFLLVALFIGIASSVHLPLKTTKKHDLIEGDMIIPPEIKEILRNKDSRNGVTDLWLRWPQATIYYQFDGVSDSNKDLVVESLAKVEEVTCLKFKQGANSDGNYVRVTDNEEGCWSYVGYLHEAGQQLNLGDGCEYKVQ